MSRIFCPKCGREVETDGDVRFCRYCGLALSETKDNLRGYSEVKREAYKFINVSFVLVAILFWIQYFGLIPWSSFTGGNLLLILIFGFVFGLWFMGNWVVDRPAKYVKKNHEGGELAEPARTPSLSPGEPIPAAATQTAELVERASVTDHTTRELSHKRTAGPPGDLTRR
ncbi:MAG TPA: zinc ribbon domain-containing protein [Pyrinomonadaceae bacterium]|nr:zinc ribbon domain-containing protein [Pyrinomonadaceae bacterium]